MAFGHVAFGKNNVVALDAADRDLLAIEFEGFFLSVLLLNQDFEHG